MSQVKNPITDDAKALNKIINTLAAQTRAFSESTFGSKKGMKLQNESQKDLIIAHLDNAVFHNDKLVAKGESSAANDRGIGSSFKFNIIDKMSKEFKERSQAIKESYSYSLSTDSAAWGVHASYLNMNQQLLLLALVPSVIKPIYNKVVKSLVHKHPFIERNVEVDRILSNGVPYNYYSLINDRKAMAKLSSGGQPTIRMEIPFEGTTKKSADNTNLITMYNGTLSVSNPHGYAQVKSASDFIQKGVKIVGYREDQVNNGQIIPVEWVSAGEQIQSGELTTTVCTINCPLSTEGYKSNVRILGTIQANGDIELYTNSDKIKSVVFEFIIPAKGAQNPFNVTPQTTKVKNWINQKAAAATTLNALLQDDYQSVTGTNYINFFTEKVVNVVNRQKDIKFLDFVDNTINNLLSVKTMDKTQVRTNYETTLNQYNHLAYSKLDMNSGINYGYTDTISGQTMLFSKNLFDVCNSLDSKIRPEKKEFSMYSSSYGAFFVRSVSGESMADINYVGEALEENATVGGLQLPYTMKRVSVGRNYFINYIVTNILESVELDRNVNFNDVAGVGTAKSTRYTILPNFEEERDTFLFVNGLEYVTEGYGNPEYNLDKTLQYETRFDIISYNKALAVIDFTDEAGKTK